MRELVTILAVSLTSVVALAQDAPPTAPDVVVDFAYVSTVRDALRSGDERFAPALTYLRDQADELLEAGPYSVVDKQAVPPSGDKHDYMSMGPYWWPNPDTPDGLPYVRRDGQTNPERRNYPDSSAWQHMTGESHTLALAYYFTGDERYAEHAALLLRTWFIDADTRMNPNLKYGQAIPGRVEGRDIGIIDTRRVHLVPDTLSLLAGSTHWKEEDDAGVRAWLGAYLDWLVYGDYRTEGRKRNNHATFYDVQVVSLAIAVGEDELARDTLEAVKHRRIATQIQPSGEQPEETARADGWSYTLFNLQALCLLAQYGEQLGVDLWGFETDDDRSIRRAFAYLEPYVVDVDDWPHTRKPDRGPERLQSLVYLASSEYDDAAWVAAIERMPPVHPASRLRLLVRLRERA